MIMQIKVRRLPGAPPHQGELVAGGQAHPCSLGRSGIIAAGQKREGDGGTPAGRWPIRAGLYRSDRVRLPDRLAIGLEPLARDDGWCDAPGDPAYNRPVSHPYPASAERLWRDDGLYDLIIILGYNDDPVVQGAGSAIFLHCRADDGGPTEGCIALARETLLALVKELKPTSALMVDREC